MFLPSARARLIAVSTVLALLAGLGPASAKAAKKLVCTVTLNSDNEKNAFVRYLDNSEFDFVELAPQEGSFERDHVSEPAWFRRACREKVQCDILVVSGHFGGNFFGETGLTLPLQALEKAACDTSCDGILKHPQEVYLFGCNTLASKKPDGRSVGQYYQVLVNEGVPAGAASQIAAYRYSPVGGSFHDRMARLFSRTPRIYGFSSIAPLGEHIEPGLQKYFEAATGRGYYTARNIGALDASKNTLLLQTLNDTAILQTRGIPGTAPICLLSSRAVKRLDKLLWIEKTLNGADRLASLPEIQDYAVELRGATLDADENAVLTRIRANTAAASALRALIANPQKGLLTMQLGIARLMSTLGWIDNAAYAAKVQTLILGDTRQAFGEERADEICSAGVDIQSLNLIKVPASYWSNSHFVRAVGCLAPQNPNLAALLARRLRLGEVEDRVKIAEALGQMKARAESAQLALVEILKDESAPEELRTASFEALKKIRPRGERVQLALGALMKSEESSQRMLALQVLRAIRPGSLKVQMIIVEALKDEDIDINVQAGEALRELKPASSAVREALRRYKEANKEDTL